MKGQHTRHDEDTRQRIAETIRTGSPTGDAHRTSPQARLAAVDLPLFMEQMHFTATGGRLVAGDDLREAVSTTYMLEDAEEYRAAEITINYEPSDTDDPIGALEATQAVAALLLHAPNDLTALLAASSEHTQELAGFLREACDLAPGRTGGNYVNPARAANFVRRLAAWTHASGRQDAQH